MNLHNMQGAVKPSFACHAVASVCTLRKNADMRIRLREHRDRIGLTLEALAERTNFSFSQLSRWERGESNIPSKTLPELAEAYECRVSEIFADDDQEDDPTISQIMNSSFALDRDHRKMALRLIRSLADDQGREGAV